MDRDGVLRITLELLPDGTVRLGHMDQQMLLVWCQMQGRALRLELTGAGQVLPPPREIIPPGAMRLFTA